MVGYIIVFIAFGIGGTWAFFAPLDSAIQGSGVVAVQSSRKIIQHLEGGIISEILVRDGDHVEAGTLLFKLDDTTHKSQLEVQRNVLLTSLIKEARLITERDSQPVIVFPRSVLEARSNGNLVRAMDDEIATFQQRKQLLATQLQVQSNRMDTSLQEIEGLQSEEKSAREQGVELNRELVGLRELLKRQMVPLTRVTTLERERVRLEGLAARSRTDQAKVRQQIVDAEIQIAQLRTQFQNGISTEIIDIRKAIADAHERVAVAQDIVNRLEVRAPQAGVVQSRRFGTIGAVVRAGDALLDIAPIDEPLVIQAKVSTRDVSVMKRGIVAEVRFPGFKAAETPLITGRIRSVSYDRIMDPSGGNPHFAVEVEVDGHTIPAELKQRLRAGMDADILVPTGERSALTYMLEPLTDRLRYSFRER
ncbi:MAG: HlyD family type I secretion periplasmic adaptor subunit [Beijerinckiaceae bacterium]